MPKKIESLNDLSITIHEINKHYHISDFVAECKREMGSISDLLTTSLSKSDGLQNPVRKILEMSKYVPDDELERMVSICEKLNSKYGYERYLDECEHARDDFLKDRSEYFSAKILTKPDKDETLNIFDLSNTSDYLLADWIEKILKRVSPKPISVAYEDLTGKVQKIKICHYPEIKLHSDGSVETRLIDRHHGINAYDSFLLRSFYSLTEAKWVLIPMRLIIKMDCSEELDIMLEEESQKSRQVPKNPKKKNKRDVDDMEGDVDHPEDNPDYY
jgi:hypothetical protein